MRQHSFLFSLPNGAFSFYPPPPLRNDIKSHGRLFTIFHCTRARARESGSFDGEKNHLYSILSKRFASLGTERERERAYIVHRDVKQTAGLARLIQESFHRPQHKRASGNEMYSTRAKFGGRRLQGGGDKILRVCTSRGEGKLCFRFTFALLYLLLYFLATLRARKYARASLPANWLLARRGIRNNNKCE